MNRVETIEALLPQTQCSRCGYPGCHPYAEAVAQGRAEINQCPPGGAALIGRLAALLGRAPLPLDPTRGRESPPQLAQIDARACIGCAKCLPPCPVDAIIGAHKQLHTVVTELCTGCELCIAPCPVDCITLVPRPALPPPPAPVANRLRYAAHAARLERRALERSSLLAARKRLASSDPSGA